MTIPAASRVHWAGVDARWVPRGTQITLNLLGRFKDRERLSLEASLRTALDEFWGRRLVDMHIEPAERDLSGKLIGYPRLVLVVDGIWETSSADFRVLLESTILANAEVVADEERADREGFAAWCVGLLAQP